MLPVRATCRSSWSARRSKSASGIVTASPYSVTPARRRGPGEGTVKRILPDAHTDFIFAVTAEEFGIVVCMALALLFALIVLRALFVAQRAEDPFVRLGVTGLALLFGIQAAINMMVNLHMMPAKGMTLPFISYGGSSLISLALGTGFLLALTRKRPRAESFGKPERRS